MNKKILAVVLILLLLGLGGFFYMRSKGGASSIANITSSGSKSLKDIISSGSSQKCTFTSVESSNSSEGTSYISNGMIRSDFSTTISGKTTKSHMISDGKTNYIWTDGDPTGFKTLVSGPDSTNVPNSSTSTDTGNSQPASLDQKSDYKCSVWLADSSYFVPPTNIKFTDLSEVFKATSVPTVKSGTTESSSQCAVCDSLTGDDKTQCRASLNCK